MRWLITPKIVYGSCYLLQADPIFTLSGDCRCRSICPGVTMNGQPVLLVIDDNLTPTHVLSQLSHLPAVWYPMDVEGWYVSKCDRPSKDLLVAPVVCKDMVGYGIISPKHGIARALFLTPISLIRESDEECDENGCGILAGLAHSALEKMNI